MSRPPLGQSVRGSCHHQPCSHSPSPTAEAPQPPMPSICLHVLFPGLGVLTAPSPPPLPILCHVPPPPGSLPWLPPTSGPLIASLECPQLSLPSFFAAQATLACFTIYRRPCSLQGGCAPGLYSAPPTAFLKHLLSVGATVASASLTINPTWSVFETLLGPPAPQPETLGAQLCRPASPPAAWHPEQQWVTEIAPGKQPPVPSCTARSLFLGANPGGTLVVVTVLAAPGLCELQL